MKPSTAFAVLACGLLTACGGGAPDDNEPRGEPLTRQQRDSVIGQSSLPGAGAVNRALETSQTAADRAAQLDSIR